MALYAFDGTGNEDEDNDTNALEFFRAFQDPLKNDDPGKSWVALSERHRHARANTRPATLLAEQWRVSAVTAGYATRWIGLGTNQAAGDTDIHTVGFSRGAALALSFANEVAHKYPALLSASLASSMSWVSSGFLVEKSTPAMTSGGRPTPNASAMRWRSTRARVFFPLTRRELDGVGRSRGSSKCGFAACIRTSAAATTIAA